MKRFTRIISLILVFIMVAAIPAYAQEQSARASSYFSSYRAYCTKLSPTSLGVSFLVIGADYMDVIGASEIKVQKSLDGESWTTVRTLSMANYSNMTDTNTGAHGSTVSCTVASGYYYRAVITFYAKKGIGTAYHTYYTSKV